MEQARVTYTFFHTLKWSWAIALGYAASIWVHILVNGLQYLAVITPKSKKATESFSSLFNLDSTIS